MSTTASEALHTAPRCLREVQPFPIGSADSAIAHLPVLDGLRGAAVLLVMAYHSVFLFGFGGLPESGIWRWATGAWIGVDLFFVVSGFLITGILLRTRDDPAQLRTFWMRRALRILPLGYFYLFALCGLQACGWLTLWDRPERALVYFLYLGNADIAAHGAQPLPLMILWSLAVEEQFYLFWPLLVRRTTPMQLLRVCVFLTLAAPIARGVVANYPAAYVLTICRVDSLAVGAGLAVLLTQAATRAVTLQVCRRFAPLALLALVGVLALPLGPSFPQTRPAWFTLLGYSAVAFAFAALVGASIDGGRLWRTLLTAPPLLYIGKRCYGFYVWQCLVGMTIAGLMPRSLQTDYRLLTAASWVAATAAVAAISWSLLERPALRLKRFFPHADRTAERVPTQGAQIRSAHSVPLS